jgi:hypothetical protein
LPKRFPGCGAYLGDGDTAEDTAAGEYQRCSRHKTPGGTVKAVKCRKDKYAVKIAILAVLFMLPLLLTGCWNNRDLTEINIVSAFGIDRMEDGKVFLTAQVVEPAAIQSTSSGKGKGGGAQPKPVFF